MRFLPLLLVVACGQQRGFGGQDLGGDNVMEDDTDLAGSTQDPSLADLPEMDSATCDQTTTDTVEQELILTAGAGSIAVSHVGIVDQCCADWRFEAVTTGDTIAVTYFDVSDMTCDCECPWTLDYTLLDVPAGDWTVTAEGDEGQVTVD